MNYGILLKCTNNVQHEVDSGARVKDCARRAGPRRFVIRHGAAASYIVASLRVQAISAAHYPS